MLKKSSLWLLILCLIASMLTVSVFADENTNALPNAEVTSLGAQIVTVDSYYIYDLVGSQKLTSASDPFALQIAMEFAAKDTPEQAEANAYGGYTTDFFIEVGGLANGSVVADGCYLAGYYATYGAWVVIPLDGFTIEQGVTYPVITSAGFDFSYVDICASVQDFVCGIYFADEVLAANPDLTVELSLGLSENADEARKANFVCVDSYTYDVEDFENGDQVADAFDEIAAAVGSTELYVAEQPDAIAAASQEFLGRFTSYKEGDLANAKLTLNIAVKNVVANSNNLPARFVYDVTPQYGIGNSCVDVNELDKAVSFKLPVPANAIASGKANVYHGEEKLDGTYNIEGSAQDGYYVVVDAKNFSEYSVEPIAPVVVVANAQEAQDALYNAVPGTTIQLVAGVDYGTIVFGRNASQKVVDIGDIGGDAAGNERYSKYEDIVILGAEGATVDQITFEIGRVYNPDAWSYVEVKNLTIKDVTFTGEKTAVKLPDGFQMAVNGLSLINCTMHDADGNDRLVYQPHSGHQDLYDKTTGEYVMTTGVKNLTITGCEVVGAYQVIEARPMKNLTITNNTFKGIKARDILLASNDGTYTGTILIADNTSEAGTERFLRASKIGDATMIVTDNTITNYLGEDPDFIKVGDATGTLTLENNTASIIVEDNASAQAVLDKAVPGTIIQLVEGVNYGTLSFRAVPDQDNTTRVDIANAYAYDYIRSIEDITILGAAGAKVDAITFETGAKPGDWYVQVAIKNLVIDGVEFTDAPTASSAGYNASVFITTSNATIDGLTVKNCTLIGDNSKLNLVYLYGADGSKNVTLSGNTVDGVARLCELRGTENVTITNNVIKNTYEHGILLAGANYSGTVTIANNTADRIGDRFLRMAGAGVDGLTVLVKDNTVTNYLGSSADYIKVTDAANVVTTNGVTLENNTCTAVVYVAEVNGTKYESLQAAIDAAGAGDTVTLLTDLTLESALNNAGKGLFNIAADDEIILDLNGKTISVTDNSDGNFIVFYNYGELTVKNGTIKLTATKDRDWSAQSTVILNRGGKLTVESGSYIHLGGSDMAITIDNSANSFGNAYMYVTGGEIRSETYIAIRMRMEQAGIAGHGISNLEVSGGYIYGANRGIWGQKSSSHNGLQGTLAITGGTVENGRTDRGAIDMDSDSNEAQNVQVTISQDAVIKGAILGGEDEFAISGGSFTVAVPEKFCAEGFVPTENADGTYGVIEGTFVAEVNGTKYTTFEEALNAAQDDQTVKLLADAEGGNYSITITKTVTLDLNGYTLTLGGNNIFWIEDGGSLTVTDSSAEKDGLILAENASNLFLVMADSSFIMESGRAHAKSNVVYTGGATATVVVNGGELKSLSGVDRVFYHTNGSIIVNGGEVLGDIGFWGGTLTVNDGSFSVDVSAYCAYAKTAKQNADGLWEVVDAEKTIFIGENGYYTLEEALNAAKDGDTVEIKAAGSYVLKRGALSEGAYSLPANLTLVGTVDGVQVVNGPTIRANNLTINNVDFVNPSDRALIFHLSGDSTIKNSRLYSANGTNYSTASGKLTIDNCEIIGTASYGLNVNEGTYDLYITDTKLAGWNSFGATGTIYFDNCEFVEGGAYKNLIFYQNAEIENTTFTPGYEVGLGNSSQPLAENIVITLTGCSMTDGSALIDIIDSELMDSDAKAIIDGVHVNATAVAEVNGTKYTDLQAAINAAGAGQTVKLIENIVLTDSILITADKNVTLDLNGKTIRQEKACTAHYSMITNRGTLTITDTSAEQSGLISFKDTGAGDSKFGWGSYTVANYGTLTVNAGKIENLSEQNTLSGVFHMYSAIQQGSGAISTTINGGTITTPTYRSIRINAGDLVINGGSMEGLVWLQPSQANTTLIINGGTFAPRGGDSSCIMLTNVGENFTVSSVVINGGVLTTKINVKDITTLTGIIRGGSFTESAKANIDAALLAEGFVFASEVDENGYYTVVEATYVAEVNGTKYTDLQAAIDAAGAGQTVKLIADVTVPEIIKIEAGEKFTLDLNGKTISVAYAEGSTTNHIYLFENYGDLTITDTSAEKNGVINARGIFNYGVMTLENGTINSIDGNGGYAVRNYSGASFTMNGGKIATTLEDDHKVDEGGYDATTVRVDEGATFIMNGGEIANICDFTVAIDNYGTTTIHDGKLSSVHTTVANHGTLEIKGGSFTCNGLEGITAHAVWAAEGTTTISGGTFDGKDNYNGFNVDASNGATVIITGGEFLPVHSGSLYGEGSIAVSGGTFFDAVPENRCAEGFVPTENADGTYGVLEATYVAEVNGTKYESLQDALVAVQNGGTIQLLEGTIDLGGEGLLLPNTLKNVTVLGAANHASVIKNGHLLQNGSNFTLSNVTFEGILFEDACIVITPWDNTSVVENIKVNNCIFQNLDDANTYAPIHITTGGNATQVGVKNLTFTNNVVKNLTNGNKSGVYAFVSGDVVIENNVFDGVQFRSMLLQVYNDDGVADNISVVNNVIKNSPEARIQILGRGANTLVGADAVCVKINENVLTDITNYYQLCVYNMNPEKLDTDASKNYYDIDVAANPQAFFLDAAGESVADLVAFGVYPIYTDLKADGTINSESLYMPVAAIGSETFATFEDALKAAQNGDIITLLADVTLTQSTQIAKSIVLDGNGYTIDMSAISGESGFTIYEWPNTEVSVQFKNVKITGHSATGAYCGAISAGGGTVLTLTDCEFTNNSGDYVVHSDGAIVTIEGTTFDSNTPKKAVVVSGVNGHSDSISIVGSTFKNNTVSGTAVVYLNKGSATALGTTTLSNNTFINNKVTSSAAAVLYLSTPLTAQGNLISGNTVTGTGSNGDKCGIIATGSGANGSIISDNVLVDNTVSTTGTNFVATAWIGSNNVTLNGNYWTDGGEPEQGAGKDVYLSKTGLVLETYATTYAENTTGATVGGVEEVAVPVAAIGDVKYTTLQAAINAANGKTVTVLTDIELTESLVIPYGYTVTLELNGKIISGVSATAKASEVVLNDGTLTIQDSVGGGKITSHALNPDTNGIPAYANNTITNRGTLTLLSGTIENSTTAGYACFPIDNNSTVRDVALYIKGGTVTGRGAIRVFANSTTHANTVEITGGTVAGTSYGVWVQNPSNNVATDVKASLTIKDGTVARVLFDASAAFDFSISGGTVAKIEPWSLDETNADRNPNGFISGGTFLAAIAEEYCAEGYIPTENGDGTYGVIEGDYAAKVDGVYYTDLQEALNAAIMAGNKTVKLLCDGTYPSILGLSNGVTLDLNGYTLTANNGVVTFGIGSIVDNGATKGSLKTPYGFLALSNATYPMLPVWVDAEVGYRFVSIKNQSKEVAVEAENSFAVEFRPAFENAANNGFSHYDVFTDGAADNDITMAFVIKCVRDGEVARSIDYVVSDELIAKVYTNKTSIRFTVTGATDSYDSYVIEVRMQAKSGIVFAGDIMTYTPTASADGQ